MHATTATSLSLTSLHQQAPQKGGDVEIAYKHVPTAQNSLADASTRQGKSNFKEHIEVFKRVHDEEWIEKAETRFPARPPARPEILRPTPTLFVEEFESDRNHSANAGRRRS